MGKQTWVLNGGRIAASVERTVDRCSVQVFGVVLLAPGNLPI